MNITDLELVLSEKRLKSYYHLFPNVVDKQVAIEYYCLNTQISESLYPLLSNFEVILRNSIHNSFTFYFGTQDWHLQITDRELRNQINIAQQKIARCYIHSTTNRLIAELTLGFWTCLFNKEYASIYWKPLLHIFPLLPKHERKRHIVATKLNNIRKFRNRIFHYEPICMDLSKLEATYNNLIDILCWINPDIIKWIKQIDRFDSLLTQAKALRQIR